MIHYTRRGKPAFDAIEQVPGALETVIDGVYVVYTGTVPVKADLDAHMNPPKPMELSLDLLAARLVQKGVLVAKDIDDSKEPKRVK